MNTLDFIEVNPIGPHNASVILMHGLGADGHDFEPIVDELDLPNNHGVRFIFPHAPVRPITLNAGMPMPGWYDIYGLGIDSPQDEQGIREAETAIQALYCREVDSGIDPERIIIAGFSQGGAIALWTALRLKERIGGVLALSTYLPIADIFQKEHHDINKTTPIFMAHGHYDQVLPYEFGAISRDSLMAMGFQVDWHEYDMEHSVSPEQLQDIGDWIKEVLG